VVEPPSTRGQVYEVGDEITVGRASGCQVALPDDTFVSQLHARIFRKDGQLFVEDLGSTNGTFLNRKQVSAPVAVRRGDRLQVGKTVLEVSR
jgi:pSer/pThr/pTyr-binding forkhead associated (FHA) protein